VDGGAGPPHGGDRGARTAAGRTQSRADAAVMCAIAVDRWIVRNHAPLTDDELPARSPTILDKYGSGTRGRRGSSTCVEHPATHSSGSGWRLTDRCFVGRPVCGSAGLAAHGGPPLLSASWKQRQRCTVRTLEQQRKGRRNLAASPLTLVSGRFGIRQSLDSLAELVLKAAPRGGVQASREVATGRAVPRDGRGG
jgi:hypothetical protein